MKIRPFLITLTLLEHFTQAQGFINLNFESADTSGYQPGAFIPITQALPGWSAAFVTSTSTNPVGAILYDTVSLGAPAISLQDSSSSDLPLEGNYSVILQGSLAIGPTTASIFQTGMIPGNSRSLTFLVRWGSAFSVSFDGQPLVLSEAGSTSTAVIMGADISTFAGQTGQLLFQGGGELDYIQFSPSEIPEPNATMLWGLSGLLALLRGGRIALGQ